MPSEYPFLSNPYAWLFVSALFFGAALARLTRGTARAADPERAWTAKWVAFCVWLSLSLACALGALFSGGEAAGREALRRSGTLWFFLAASALFFLAFRFKRTLGALVLLLFAALLIVTFLFLRSLQAFTGETEIARVRVLSVQGDRMVLDLIPGRQETGPEVVRLKGSYFAPVVRVVIFDDSLVFLGARTWYRFDALVSFETRQEAGRSLPRQTDTVHYLPRAPGISEGLYAWFEARDGRIPGVKTAQTELILKRPRERATYSIRVQNDGGVEVVQENSAADGGRER